MERQRDTPGTLLAESPTIRLAGATVLTIAGVALAAMVCATGNYREAVILAGSALVVGLLVARTVSVQAVLITWFATAPLLSFYVRFPTDRSIITYDRAVFALIVFLLLLKSSTNAAASAKTNSLPDSFASQRSRFSLSKFEAAWALLAVLALASAVIKSNNIAYAVRIAVDTFWLPLAAFHAAKSCLDLRRDGRFLLLGGIALALFLFATGAFELATGSDLFAYKGADIVREGERRVNGPFASDSSFAIISLLLFLFLLAAPKLFRVRFDRTGKLAYALAVIAAGLGALLPLFRGVGVALVVGWIVLQSSISLDKSSLLRRSVVPLTALAVLILLVGWIGTVAPSIAGGRLTTPRTAYGRLASWQAASEIAIDNPVAGVGLANYADYFDASHYYADEAPEEVLETKAVDSPHSNLLWIAAELGLPALALYVAANVYLFLIGWRAYKRAVGNLQRAAAGCFLAMVVAYWISGLTLSSGYYSDLNLYFLFLLGALSAPAAGSEQPAHNPQLISET